MNELLLTAYGGSILGPIAKVLGWIMDKIYILLASLGVENIALTIFDSETECKESVFVAVDKTVSRQSGVYEINNLPQLFIKGKTNK